MTDAELKAIEDLYKRQRDGLSSDLETEASIWNELNKDDSMPANFHPRLGEDSDRLPR